MEHQHVFFTAVVSLGVLLSPPVSQDYPATSEEWDHAFDAIAGGISVEGAVMPAPSPIRSVSAQLRAIWESVAVTSWSTEALYHLEWEGAPQHNQDVEGVLSDGTVVIFSVEEVFEILDTETMNQLSQAQRDAIALQEAVGWVVSGVLVSQHGDVTLDAYYLEYVDGAVERAIFAPIPRWQESTPRSNRPPCPTCIVTPAMQACFDQADLDFRRCRRFSGAIFVTGLLGSPFTGGGAIVLGTIGAVANQAVCAVNHAEDIELCVQAHSVQWWYQNGYILWR